LRVEQAQVGHQLVFLPGHQVQGIAAQVLPIDFLVRTTLLDHEHFGAQLQDGIELSLPRSLWCLQIHSMDMANSLNGARSSQSLRTSLALKSRHGFGQNRG
jgi:hypothetical protein